MITLKSMLFYHINYFRDYEKKAEKDSLRAWSMYRAMRHKRHFNIKESDIPVEILYNQDIDAIKREEIEFKAMPKPI